MTIYLYFCYMLSTIGTVTQWVWHTKVHKMLIAKDFFAGFGMAKKYQNATCKSNFFYVLICKSVLEHLQSFVIISFFSFGLQTLNKFLEILTFLSVFYKIFVQRTLKLFLKLLNLF